MSTTGVAGKSVFVSENHPAEYRRVYVWEMPVRAYHWINAIALTVLCITGYLIGAPVKLGSATEAYQQYWFGTVRFLHFLCAYVYVFNFLARIYWGFVGNRYARWNNFFPITKAQREEIVDVLKTDVFQVKLHGEISTGHNALAAFIYFLTFLAFCVQAITGFALYSSMSSSWIPRLFTWIVPLMGGDERSLLAPLVAVVLCAVHHRSRLSGVLSRLHRGARDDFFDRRRMEVRSSERCRTENRD